jgi:hypothetical protein
MCDVNIYKYHFGYEHNFYVSNSRMFILIKS